MSKSAVPVLKSAGTYNSRSAADFSKISFLCWLKSSFSFSAESFSSFDHSTVRPSRYSSIWAAHSGYFFFSSLKSIHYNRPSGPGSSALSLGLSSKLCPSGDSSTKPSVGGSKRYNFSVELTWALPYSFSDLSRDLTCNQTMWPLTWWSHDPRDM